MCAPPTGLRDATLTCECSGQTMLIADPERKLDRMVLRSGTDYCYIIPRLDGTVVLGGIKEPSDPCAALLALRAASRSRSRLL
jgi:glycine/D-amino acid oxidase-like deaminating enzyme